MYLSRTLPFLVCAFAYTHTHGMLIPKMSHIKAARIATFCTAETEPYILKVEYFNVSQKRKEAFQAFCPTLINWDKVAPIEIKTSEIQTKPREDKMAFYKQCGKQ